MTNSPIRHTSLCTALTFRRICLLVILAAVLCIPVISYGVGENFPVVPPDGFVAASRSSMELVVSSRGELEGVENVYIRSQCEWPTRLLWIAPDGQRVKKGEVIARFDTSALDERLKVRQIALVNAEAQLERARQEQQIQQLTNENRIEAAKLAVTLADLSLAGYQEGGYPQQLHTLEAKVALAEEEWSRAQDKHKFVSDMVRVGYKAPIDAENERLALMRAAQAHQAAKSDLEVFRDFTHQRTLTQMKAEADIAHNEFERAKMRVSISNRFREIQLRACQKSVEILKGDVFRYEQAIAACTVVAPRAGEVMIHRRDNQMITEGITVQPRQMLALLPDRDQLVVRVRMHESRIRMIQAGHAVQVRVDAAPSESYAGEVTMVSSVPFTGRFPNPDLREYGVLVSLTVDSEARKKIAPGMSAMVDILADRRSDALTVPLSSIVDIGGQMTAFVRRGNNIETRPVTVGLINESSAEIVEGLQDGEEVVLRPRVTCAQRINALQSRTYADAGESKWSLPAL
ncbi:efflux RND transporter periplasmic adaptor subunit [Planctomicrobium sp. SH664]|uniref:efflux RND transporter periplasmic adaptor subunit n=1 Tax=Planctomicrobium sp. SH664 TaxID=3448125 RepID=UPI003F5B7938